MPLADIWAGCYTSFIKLNTRYFGSIIMVIAVGVWVLVTAFLLRFVHVSTSGTFPSPPALVKANENEEV